MLALGGNFVAASRDGRVESSFKRSRRSRVCSKLDPNGPRLAIAGVSGAVGQEFLEVLHQRDFPYSSMKMLGSSRSAGKKQHFEGVDYTIEELDENSFGDVDIALFSAGGSVSKKFGPIASEKGCIVIDNSSAFRMTEGVPLVIPEVNADAMKDIKIGKGAIIANPNCSTIIALMAVTPLHKAAGVSSMVVSTYQAASGAGAAAMEELKTQTKEVLGEAPVTCNIFPQQYAFNIFSHNSSVDPESGYNEEELKMVRETKKIWGTDDVMIAATCIRVPVMRAHAESISLKLNKALTLEEIKELLAGFPGVGIIDERASNRFPTPLDASGRDDVLVGRLRYDLNAMGEVNGKGSTGICMFVCGDQIRKGAALNAVQIGEVLLKN